MTKLIQPAGRDARAAGLAAAGISVESSSGSQHRSAGRFKAGEIEADCRPDRRPRNHRLVAMATNEKSVIIRAHSASAAWPDETSRRDTDFPASPDGKLLNSVARMPLVEQGKLNSIAGGRVRRRGRFGQVLTGLIQRWFRANTGAMPITSATLVAYLRRQLIRCGTATSFAISRPRNGHKAHAATSLSSSRRTR